MSNYGWAKFEQRMVWTEHLHCRQLHTTDESWGIPILSSRWQYKVGSRWIDSTVEYVERLADTWKGIVTWSIEHET